MDGNAKMMEKDSIEKLTGVIGSLGEVIKTSRNRLNSVIAINLDAQQEVEASKPADKGIPPKPQSPDRIENLIEEVKGYRDIAKMEIGKLIDELDGRLQKL